ncbi:MAG: hypothetical protein L0215_07045 [Gemmataceae bacterium]|nr:hypothetical protein [Gemmataceae bacterium]
MTWSELKRELQKLGLKDDDEIVCIRWEGAFEPQVEDSTGGAKFIVNGLPMGARVHAPFQSPHRAADLHDVRPYLIYFYDTCVGEVSAESEDDALREYVRQRGGNEVGLSAYPAQVEKPSLDPAATVTV